MSIRMKVKPPTQIDRGKNKRRRNKLRSLFYAILRNKDVLLDQDALNIAVALYFLKNPLFKEMAFYFYRNYSYTPVWYRIYGLFAEIKDEEVEYFFVDYLIEDDKEHQEIKKIIDKYFSV